MSTTITFRTATGSEVLVSYDPMGVYAEVKGIKVRGLREVSHDGRPALAGESDFRPVVITGAESDIAAAVAYVADHAAASVRAVEADIAFDASAARVRRAMEG